MRKLKPFLIVFLLFAACVRLSIPALPMLCRIFLSFPKLESAEVYKGTVLVEGEEICRRAKWCTPPDYYVISPSGKHEIYWGLPGDRIQRHEKHIIQGATGIFWFHPIFGVIQEDITIHKNGLNTEEFDKKFADKRAVHSYEERKEFYEKHFNYTKYFMMFSPLLIFSIITKLAVKNLFKKTEHKIEDR